MAALWGGGQRWKKGFILSSKMTENIFKTEEKTFLKYGNDVCIIHQSYTKWGKYLHFCKKKKKLGIKRKIFQNPFLNEAENIPFFDRDDRK